MAAWLAGTGLNNAGWMIVAGLVIAGYVVMYVRLKKAMNRAVADLRREFEERSSSLLAAVKEAAQTVKPAAAVVAAPVASPAAAPVPAARPAAVAALHEEVAPEILLVIAAAVTAFLGKKVRIRSARIVYSQENYNPWSQQGRVFVQASHNLTQRY